MVHYTKSKNQIYLEMEGIERVEIAVILVLIGFQLYFAFKLWQKIVLYKNVFKNPPLLGLKDVSLSLYNEGDVDEILLDENFNEDVEFDNPTIRIAYLVNNSKNVVISEICNSINTYLIKNKSAAIDFHILKDITDRNVEIKEGEIDNNIPAPLYIGLAATMLGIIFGLFAINFNTSTSESATLALEAIKPLIDGVKIAMTASVTGLIITTVFSILIFKSAKSKVENGKNEFLSFLQSELLPKMNKSKLPEVQTLSNKLDKFARSTSGVVAQLDSVVKNSSQAINREQDLIEQIKELDVKKVASVNLDVFNQLQGMMGSFQEFAKYYEHLDKSLLNTSNLLSNLQVFVANTHNINVILEDIKSTVAKSNQSTEFFNTHIKSFVNYEDAVKEAVANTDSKMSRAIEELTSSAHKQFEAYNSVISEYDSKLSTAFNKSIESFTEVMTKQVAKTEEAFNTARPKFELLSKLNKLDVIEERLQNLENELTQVISNGNNSIVKAIEAISIKSIKVESETKIPELNFPKPSVFQNIVSTLSVLTYTVIISGACYYVYINYFK
ncbi:MAG: hypothetical protein CMC76_09070 [Flavobacteriaceae bacterium]|nr:hypothetical protein [Flavobacteriaceae bacterium]